MDPPLSRPRESDIIRSVDAFLTADAEADLAAINRLRPGPDAWGFLIGHRRGPRVLVERLFPAGAGHALPPPAEIDTIDRGFGRKIVGLYAVRPSAAFLKTAAGPYFYGRLVLDIRPSRREPVLKLSVVEFASRIPPSRSTTNGRFRLTTVAVRTAGKGERP